MGARSRSRYDHVSAHLEGHLIGFAKVVRHIDSSNDRKDDARAIELAKALARIEVEVEHRRRLEAQLLTAVEQERERLGRICTMTFLSDWLARR